MWLFWRMKVVCHSSNYMCMYNYMCIICMTMSPTDKAQPRLPLPEAACGMVDPGAARSAAGPAPDTPLSRTTRQSFNLFDRRSPQVQMQDIGPGGRSVRLPRAGKV